MSVIKKAFAITDARIGFVSLVDKAANKKQFLITKAENGDADFLTNGKIIKSDAENHYVTGIVYAPMEEDAHGNYMTEEEIRKAAYWFTKNGNKIDIQHEFEPIEDACVVESWIEKADTTIEGEPIKKGTWLMTVELPEESEAWNSVKKGELTGFSMGGVGKYSEVDDDITGGEIEKAKDAPKGIFKRLAKALGFDVVEKGAVTETFQRRTQSDLFWNAWYALQETLSRYNYYTDRTEFEKDESVISAALEEFSAIVLDVLGEKSLTKALLPASDVIQKSGKKLSAKNRTAIKNAYESLGVLLSETEEKEEDEMDEQKVQKMIDEAIKKAMNPEPANNIDPSATPVEPANGTALTEEAVTKMVEAAVKKAMGAIEPPATPEGGAVTAENIEEMIDSAVKKAMEPVLKSAGLPSNLNDGLPVKKNEEAHYMAGMF